MCRIVTNTTELNITLITMNKIKPTPLIILAAFLIPISLIVAAVPQHKAEVQSVHIDSVMNEVLLGQQYYSVHEVAEFIVNKDPSVLLFDVRSVSEYEKFSLPNAFNMPLQSMSVDTIIEAILGSERDIIFFSNGTVNANQAYTIARMKGAENVYVMQGGLNAWGNQIINAQPPSASASEDEIAKYNFSKGAAQATGGSEIQTNNTTTVKKKPAIKKRKKKKPVAGGC